MSKIIIAIVIIAVISVVYKLITKEETVNNQYRRTQTNTIYNVSRDINETGSMIYYANDKHGANDKLYEFNFKKVNNSWRAYILRMPSLGNRDSSGIVTHRRWDNGKPFVCWDKDIHHLEEMQTIAKFWADCIQEYIATGKKFG